VGRLTVDVTRWLNEIGWPQYVDLWLVHGGLDTADVKEAKALLDRLRR